jgi:preprotein translocase subunit SecF
MSPNLEGKRHTLADIYHERTNFQFTTRKWRWLTISGALIVISLLALFVNGLNRSIDFTGGLAWQVPITGDAPPVDEVRDSLRPFGLAEAEVTIRTSRSGGEDTLLVQAEDVPRGEQLEVAEVLADDVGTQVDEVSINDVSATWGNQITEKAARALVVFFVLLAVYLSFRFEWKMALCAIIAVLHDILLTAGIYAITGFLVSPATVIAVLTILGFSLYDTVVVYDKVKENADRLGTVRGETYSSMVNRSLNEVLMRSLNTSVVALLPVASLLVVGSWMFGAVSLRDFALALLVGLAAGAYSSIFVATPLLAWWKEREPRYRALADRATARGDAPAPAPVAVGAPAPAVAKVAAPSAPATAPSPAPSRVSDAAAPAPAAPERPTAPAPPPTPGLTPRPRQPRRRKRRR